MKSTMVAAHSMAMVPRVDMQRSTFNLSKGHKTTFQGGDLVPLYHEEILPGDTFNLRAVSFARLTTPIVPIMDNLFLDWFFFFVPNRLVWEHWVNFMGEREEEDNPREYTPPKMNYPALGIESLSIPGYYGLPTGIQIPQEADRPYISSLPMRGYFLIWNEWFRAEYLQDKAYFDKSDVDDDYDDLKTIMKRCKRPDYFTSCLPWPQRGDAVELPLGASAPVVGNGTAIGFTDQANDFVFANHGVATTPDGIAPYLQKTFPYYTTGQSIATGDMTTADKAIGLVSSAARSGMIADLSKATAATINSLREAFQLQRMLERDARGGTRYIELLKSHFNVTNPDFRLQRPELLCTSSTRISINPVQQTAPKIAYGEAPVTTTPLGFLGAYGQVADQSPHFVKSFTEHGHIIGICNVRADLNYQQGLERKWSRETRYDYPWPALAHLGEQEVLTKELDLSGNPTYDNKVFGYMGRYDECRYGRSIITGLMNSACTGTSLDVWHLAQEFTQVPVLDDLFIQDPTEEVLTRVMAVQSEPQIYIDCYFDVKATRCLPTYAVPGLIDHF